MDIFIVGTEQDLHECREKFGEGHNYEKIDLTDVGKNLKPSSIVFDFDPKDVSVYVDKDIIVFLNSTNTTLAALTSGRQINAILFGFCGLPTFLNREILEVTARDERSTAVLEKTCIQLNTKYKIVEDKVGMITPRIIGMIINEAYFANEGDVASRNDIDLAMKLGTNYPFGPFEWSKKIGIKNIYELLKAVHNDTKDDRYKISSQLEREALA